MQWHWGIFKRANSFLGSLHAPVLGRWFPCVCACVFSGTFCVGDERHSGHSVLRESRCNQSDGFRTLPRKPEGRGWTVGVCCVWRGSGLLCLSSQAARTTACLRVARPEPQHLETRDRSQQLEKSLSSLLKDSLCVPKGRNVHV